AIDLLKYAKSIQLIEYNSRLRADEESQNKIKTSDKVTINFHTKIVEVKGDQAVSGILVENVDTKEQKEIPLSGIFVEIGSIPNSECVKYLVELNERGEVVVDHKSQSVAETPGLFAAGDVADCLYKQNNISMGDGVKALLSAYQYLLNLKK
ncbi:MAG: alkyl hydroperoxide reductase subunit, partial [uncultured bacterium]